MAHRNPLTIICAFILALLGMAQTAQAADCTFTVVANPEHITQITGGANSDPATLAFSPEGTENTISSTPTYFYIKVTPKTGVIYSVKVYDAQGNPIASPLTNKTALATGMFTATNLNGGQIVVESALDTPKYVSLTINGSPADVNLDFSGKKVTGLQEGENQVEITGKYMNISYGDKTKPFYRLTYNGTAKKPTESEGSLSYAISNPQDGDKVVIDVDYPAGPWQVDIVVPEECHSFVQSITVDGAAQAWTPGEPLMVDGGKTVRVQGDVFGYIVRSTAINGTPTAVATTSVSLVVEGNTAIAFDVQEIHRDKTFTFKSGDLANASMRTALGSYWQFPENTTSTATFCNDDNRITFSADRVGSDTSERSCVWQLNGKVVAIGLSLTCSVQQGDEISVAFVPDSQTPPIECEALTLGATGMYSYASHSNTVFTADGDVKAYVINSVPTLADDAYTLTLTPVTGIIPAETGLMLVGTPGAPARILLTSEQATADVSRNILMPAYQGTTIPGSTTTVFTYVFGTVNGETGFWKINGDKPCTNGNHAYFRSTIDYTATANARCLQLAIDDDQTAIATVQTTANGNGIFTITGTRIRQANLPGIYIAGGKKIIKK